MERVGDGDSESGEGGQVGIVRVDLHSLEHRCLKVQEVKDNVLDC